MLNQAEFFPMFSPRQLRWLYETIADNPHVNAEIERGLAAYPREMQIDILDALEALKDAGPTGLTVLEWAQRIRAINSDAGKILKLVLQAAAKFSIVVHKLPDGRWAWISGDDTLAVDPETQRSAHSTVELVSQTQELMRRMGEFTTGSLAQAIANEQHMPEMAAHAFADHMINNMRGMLELTPQGGYRVRPEPVTTRDDNMHMFRDIVKKGLGQ